MKIRGFDLSIKKSGKNRKYFQRARLGQSVTKQVAMKDISEHDDTINYVANEALVLTDLKNLREGHNF